MNAGGTRAPVLSERARGTTPGVVISGQGSVGIDGNATAAGHASACVRSPVAGALYRMTQLRLVAAVAVISGLTAAGAVLAEEWFGVSALRQDLRRTR